MVGAECTEDVSQERIMYGGIAPLSRAKPGYLCVTAKDSKTVAAP
jgi:hypothetical protein